MNGLGNTPADKDYKPSGISRAEERALEAYPVTMVRRRYDGIARSDDPYDSNLHDRYCFKRGYEQAEKDLGLTWEDVSLLNNIRTEEINRIVSESKDEIIFTDNDELSKIVLKKFNKIKGNE